MGPIASSPPLPSVSPATGYGTGEKCNLTSRYSEIYKDCGESCLGEIHCPSISKDQTLVSIHFQLLWQAPKYKCIWQKPSQFVSYKFRFMVSA